MSGSHVHNVRVDGLVEQVITTLGNTVIAAIDTGQFLRPSSTCRTRCRHGAAGPPRSLAGEPGACLCGVLVLGVAQGRGRRTGWARWSHC
ncbi:MAG: hypothetical protein ACRDRU_19210 [Pseudonocardiaceae bacterium]